MLCQHNKFDIATNIANINLGILEIITLIIYLTAVKTNIKYNRRQKKKVLRPKSRTTNDSIRIKRTTKERKTNRQS